MIRFILCTLLAIMLLHGLIRRLSASHTRTRSSRLAVQPRLVGPRARRRSAGNLGRRVVRVGRDPEPLNDLPQFVDDIARRCSSGDSLSAAFTAAAKGHTCAHVFAPTVQSLTQGSTLSEALRHSPVVRHDDVLLTWHVLKLCALHGGVLNEPLDRAAATLRSRQAIVHERRAQSAQARLSAQVLTVAPIAFAAWTALTTPTVRDFFASPAGLICVSAGALMNALGWFWMNRIVGAAS